MNEGRPDGAGSPEEFDEAAFEAAFEEAFGATAEPDRTFRRAADADGDSAEPTVDGGAAPGAEPLYAPDGVRKRSVVAVVLTPITSAPALAGLCAIAKIDADIVPVRRGSLAVRVIPQSDQVDPEEFLTGAPAAAVDLAATLSRTAKAGVILLISRLGEGDEGLTGTISGRSYVNGDPGEEVSAGLILANADDVLENLLLGVITPEEAPGHLKPANLTRWQAGRLFGRTQRKKKP
ncbi:hypothetical protein EXU48_17245 [Occultella glacieicola]|uniref:Uncharacterized protein n=1 Tax=Occultella glacieicola TaxID=2518684 RepID=A0ABY2E587_9MICO|nr:hypothetical protein [Occultella glacieicola]TDE90851.1 hypothetical protein EXU48_17245 [Occultella glacieicola]